MALDEGSSAVGTRYLGEGFRHEPDFREGTTTFDAASPPVTTISLTETETGTKPSSPPVVRRGPAVSLRDVFDDDPTEGASGRDRLLVHGLWELVLVLALAGAGYLLYRVQPATFSGDGLRTLLLTTAALGAVAVASGLALRAGVPNLAVGAVAVAAGFYAGQHPASLPLWTVLVVLAGAAVVGAVQGLVIVGAQVPGWAVSFGVGLALLAWADRQPSEVPAGGYAPLVDTYYWFGGFCALSVGAAVVGVVPPVRRALGRFRPVADPARRRGLLAAGIVVVVTVVSTMLASAGGFLSVSLTDAVTASEGIELTGLALGAALLGGTSAHGRRGGIFGTVLAVCLLTVVDQYLAAVGWSWGTAALPAGVLGMGLAVTRLVERFSRPEAPQEKTEDEDWEPTVHGARGRQPATAATTPTAVDLWRTGEPWGAQDAR